MSKVLVTHKIVKLKRLLRETDYLAIKFAEGCLTAEEFEPTKKARQEWRNEINVLEKEIELLGDA